MYWLRTKIQPGPRSAAPASSTFQLHVSNRFRHSSSPATPKRSRIFTWRDFTALSRSKWHARRASSHAPSLSPGTAVCTAWTRSSKTERTSPPVLWSPDPREPLELPLSSEWRALATMTEVGSLIDFVAAVVDWLIDLLGFPGACLLAWRDSDSRKSNKGDLFDVEALVVEYDLGRFSGAGKVGNEEKPAGLAKSEGKLAVDCSLSVRRDLS